MSQKIYQYILKSGVLISLLSVFLVYKRFLFPYITSKQIFFNIIIEILFIFWVAYIVKFPSQRPKKSYITFGLIGFFVALLLSCLTTVDLNLSFWGDIERMLGIFHLLHFLAFYLIIITVFTEWMDWKILFIASVLFATFVSLYGLGGKEAYATIGNTAYVGGYLIFNLFFVLLLFFKEKNKGLRWLYVIPAVIILMEFKKVNISGAFVGLGTGILALVFIYGVFAKNKKIKYTCLISFVLLSLFTILLFANKDAEWVKGNSSLRVIHSINFQKDTFQTRLISWKAALKDFPNHPILGTGHGNFAITFDKYFDPKFYNFTRSETYFDRAHNNIIDIASTTGILGLLAYLSIFVALGYYLVSGFIKKKISIHVFAIISSLIVAYFVQNLAVFDSLVTYISLMLTLGFVYWLYEKGEEDILDKVHEKTRKTINSITKDNKFTTSEVYALVLAGAAMVLVLYQYNIKPAQMLIGTIDGQMAFSQGDINKTVEIYQDTLGQDTILDRDSRTTFLRIFSQNPSMIQRVKPEKQEETINFLLEQAKKNVAYNEGDSLNQMMYAQLLNSIATYYKNNTEKFEYYSQMALDAIDKSIEASPQRIPIYYQKAQIYLSRKEDDKALETLQYALGLNEDYYDSHCYLAKTLFYLKREEEGYEHMDECISMGGVNLLAPTNFVGSLLAHYIENKDLERAVKLFERLTRLEPKNVKIWIGLAKVYKELGQPEKAKEAAEKAANLDASIGSYADEFIKSIERAPEAQSQ